MFGRNFADKKNIVPSDTQKPKISKYKKISYTIFSRLKQNEDGPHSGVSARSSVTVVGKEPQAVQHFWLFESDQSDILLYEDCQFGFSTNSSASNPCLMPQTEIAL